MTRLVLASTSPYRRELLARLRLPFDTAAPHVDETVQAGETPRDVAMRLARAKAEAVAVSAPGAVIIGSDQVADLDGRALGKPGALETAARQLRDCAGRTVAFHTAVCVLDTRLGAGREVIAQTVVDETRVVFRDLADDEIARYLHAEQPYDCAGSFKCEGLGTVLFERIETSDPTALIGLPLIALAATLRRCGYALP